MSVTDWLATASNVAAIATAFVAVWAFAHFRASLRDRKAKLERFVHGMAGMPEGHVTVVQCMAALGMTEAEVINAAHSSTNLRLRVRPEYQGAPEKLLLEYDFEREKVHVLAGSGRALRANAELRKAMF
jgi:hypothetical protein